jgi:pimeloyl-ACP methyl ester carboxylesterase
VLLLHGYPYDIHSYGEVIPLLVDAGLRVIAPHLRGHGPTRFLDPSTSQASSDLHLGQRGNPEAIGPTRLRAPHFEQAMMVMS